MDHITQELINNGLTLRNQVSPRQDWPDASRGGEDVGRPTSYPAALGTGREHATSLHAGSLAPAHDHFATLLTEHEAESEYQGFLAQLEAEDRELTDRQEASAYLGVAHALAATFTGSGVDE